jgi:dCMP deaminase
MEIDIKWDTRFMKLAKEISTWSKDPSTKVGAIIVNNERRILATGYNGFPRGIKDTAERLNDREKKYPLIVHAEMNALMNALYNGVSVKNATIYVWPLPICSECTKNIIQSGITRVSIISPKNASEMWKNQWEKTSKLMFEEAGVKITYLDDIEKSQEDETHLKSKKESIYEYMKSGIRSIF